VDHVRAPIQNPPKGDLRGDPTQRGKALRVVGPILAVRPQIRIARPSEQMRRVEGEDRRTRRSAAGDEPRRSAEEIVDSREAEP
jgi:hypothetical protein